MLGLKAIEPAMSLEAALRLCFEPDDDAWTIATLRTEIKAGTLPYEIIAGKIAVTKSGIREMREKCRDRAKARASTSGGEKGAPKSGSSETEQTSRAQDAALATAEALKKRSGNTSPKSTRRPKHTADLIVLSSRT